MGKVENFRIFYRMPGSVQIHVQAFEDIGHCADRIRELKNRDIAFKTFSSDGDKWRYTDDGNRTILLTSCINSGKMPIIYHPATC